MSPYGVGGGHRHTPEIEQGLSKAAGEPVTVSFTPTLAPMSRGILTTATARVSRARTPEQLRAPGATAYDDEPFVHLLPEGQWPHTKSVQGCNHAVMQLAVDVHAGRVIVTCAIDNLTKGTAGGAVQSMNIALGLPETAGLDPQGDRTVSITAPKGFRAAGVTAGLKASGNPDIALVVNDGPLQGRGCRLHLATAWRPRRCTGPGKSSTTAGWTPSSSTPAAPTPAPAPQGFQNTHTTAEKTAEAARRLRHRRGGLLHRPDRRAAPDGQDAARRRCRRGSPGHRRRSRRRQRRS